MAYLHTTGYQSQSSNYLVQNYQASGGFYTLEQRLTPSYTRQTVFQSIAATPAQDEPMTRTGYSRSSTLSYFAPHPAAEFDPEPFLLPDRPRSPWTADFGIVSELVEKIFHEVTSSALPSDVTISIVPAQELFARHAEIGGEP